MPNGTVKVLFVCLGNICRSPMAEAVFRELVEKNNLRARFEIQSAGTGGWHAGERAHRGTREVLSRHGIDPNGLIAKQVSQDMLDQADYVVAMDSENLSDLRSWQIEQGKLSRLLDYATDINVRDVPDPYYDGRFELVYELARLGSQGLLKHIREQHAI
ncbi:MAG: low molecular weight phosphotyrosine protein phosphatase [Thermoflexales bacterium]|nr:low molecular weight phosphotyrosine protein phosphatase [Thermoflexales bacterium]